MSDRKPLVDPAVDPTHDAAEAAEHVAADAVHGEDAAANAEGAAAAARESADLPASGSPASSSASSMPDAKEPARGRDVGLPGGDEDEERMPREDQGSTAGSRGTGERTMGRPDRF